MCCLCTLLWGWQHQPSSNTGSPCISAKGVSPMFTRPYVPQSLCSPLYDISPYVSHVPSPYVTQKCFPVPLLPKLILPNPCVPQYPCFPYSPVPMFPSPYVPQSLCSSVHFPSPYRCSPVPMLPSPYVPPTNSPVPMFPSPYVPPTNSPVLMFPSPIPQKCLGNIGTGEHLIYRDWGAWGLGNKGTAEHRDWGT